MQNPTQWRQQIDADYGSDHPMYGLISRILGDWELCYEVWSGLINTLSIQVDREQQRLDNIRKLVN